MSELLVDETLEALLRIPSRLELTVVVKEDLCRSLGRLLSFARCHRGPLVQFLLGLWTNAPCALLFDIFKGGG